MLNLIVLCHRCFGWAEPVSDRCPECGAEVAVDQPDPDREVIAQFIGEPISVAGPVRIDRRSLPSFGHLIVTTGGVMFLPRLHRRLNGALEATSSQRSPAWWPFQGDQSSPKFLAWLRRPFSDASSADKLSMPIGDNQEGSLVDRLIESPGAFFVARSTIRSILTLRRSVELNRAPMRTVIINDESGDGSLTAALSSIEEQIAEN